MLGLVSNFEKNVNSILYRFPDNLPLYRDSGLFQLRSDDMEEVLMQQGVNENIDDFIERIIKAHGV